jgi:iron complex transport system substrate-binding protein
MRRALLLLAVLAGCGSDNEPADSPSASGAGAFPARVAHKFGVTTVPERPSRIVIVGLTEQDTVLELGYKPIATTEWYGEQPHAVWPWARPLLGKSKPVVLDASDGLDYERIAELRPDLIIGVNAGVKKPDYEKLSRLAPTIPAAKDSTDYFSTWDEQVRLVSAALGKPVQGRALIQDVKDAYADAAADHPEFRGKTATFSQNGFYNGLIYVYPPGLNTEFLTMLGFEINPKLTPLVKRAGEQVAISEERLEVLDADVIVFATEEPGDVDKLEKVSTFGDLKAVADNRAVYTDGTLAGAMYFMTPTSLRYVLERLTPQLEAAAAGEAPRRVASAPPSG